MKRLARKVKMKSFVDGKKFLAPQMLLMATIKVRPMEWALLR